MRKWKNIIFGIALSVFLGMTPSVVSHAAEHADSDVIRNDATGIPDKTLYATILQQGDQYNGNSDGILTVGEAKGISYLDFNDRSESVVTDYTGMAEYCPNVSSLSWDMSKEVAEEVRTSFMNEYEKMEKITYLSVYVFSNEEIEDFAKDTLTGLELRCSQKMTLNVSALNRLHNLRNLSVWMMNPDGGIVGLTDALSEMPDLRYLSVSDSRLYNDSLIPDETKSKLNTFYYYSVEHAVNLNTDTISADFSKFTSLCSLTVNGPIEQITGLEQLQNLSSISLYNNGNNGNNALAELSGLPGNGGLTSISISKFKISDLKEYQIEKNTNLSSLYLMDCEVEDITGVDKLTKLSSLTLRNNNITSVEGIENLTELSQLDLSYNLLESIPDLRALTEINMLFKLQLEGNQLTLDALKDKLPEIFAENKLWQVKAARCRVGDYLCFRDLDADTLSQIVYDSENYGNNRWLYVASGAEVELSQALLDKLQQDKYQLSIRFCREDGNDITYNMETEYPHIALNQNVSLTEDSFIQDATEEDIQIVKDLFKESNGTPLKTFYVGEYVYRYGGAAYARLDGEQNESYYVYYYDRESGKIQKLENYRCYADSYNSNKVNINDQTYQGSYNNGSYIVNSFWKHSSKEGFYFLMNIKNTYIDSSEGVNSDAAGYQGVCYGNAYQLNNAINEQLDKMSSGDTVEAASYSQPIYVETWNRIIEKGCNLRLITVSYDETIASKLYVKNEDMIQASEDMNMNGLDTYTGVIYANSSINDVLEDGTEAAVIYAALQDYIKAADVDVYVGQNMKNGENLNLYYWYYRNFSYDASNNNTVGRDGEDFVFNRLYYKDQTPVTVKSGVVSLHIETEDCNGYVLANGPVKAQKHPEGGVVIPTPAPAATPTATPTATPEVTEAPTESPAPTAEPTATPEVTTEPTESPAPTTEPTATPEVTTEPTESPAPTAEPTATPEVTTEPAESPAPTTEPTATPEVTTEPTAEPTATPEVTAAPTESPAPTAEPTATPVPPVVVDESQIIENDKVEEELTKQLENIGNTVSAVISPKKDGENTETVKLDGSFFENMRNENKTVSVSVVNEKKEKQYEWSFDTTKVDSDKIVSVDLTVKFATEKQKEIQDLTGQTDTFYMSFSHHGVLPAPAKMTVYVGNQYADGSVVFLYYYNEDTGKIEAITEDGTSAVNAGNIHGLVVRNGYVTYTISHCSEYFLCEKDPVELKVVEAAAPAPTTAPSKDSDSSSSSGSADTTPAATATPMPAATAAPVAATDVKKPVAATKDAVKVDETKEEILIADKGTETKEEVKETVKEEITVETVPAETPQPEATNVPAETEDSSSFPTIIIIVVILALAAVGAAVVVKGKKKE